jgi:hypothetical protein
VRGSGGFRNLIWVGMTFAVLITPTTAHRSSGASGAGIATVSATETPPPPVAPRDVRFHAVVSAIGPDTRAKMGTSWRAGCPVALEDLRVIAMTHWDFAGEVRTGELIVHERYAADVATVFRRLFEAGFPIERMEPANGYMGNDPPLAQFNNTVGFNCRTPVGGGHRWSEHSYGTAVDINPDQNPYVSRAGRIEPPFGAPWVDRTLREPGMIHADDVVVEAFRSIGWRWGGFWRGTKDYMHFSANGR